MTNCSNADPIRQRPPMDSSTPVESPTPRSITEDSFDFIFPEFIRRRSLDFWTPIEVARRAAEFLAPEPDARVLDVGSGVGKFCIVGAAMTGASFSGVEQRANLVEIAKTAAREFQISRVDFTVGTIEDIDWCQFDAFYLFNPFEENVFANHGALDRSVVLSEARFWADVAFVERKLARLPVGVRVATFHGFGGRIPPSYELVAQHPLCGAVLRFWTKVSPKVMDDAGTLEALMPPPILAPDESNPRVEKVLRAASVLGSDT